MKTQKQEMTQHELAQALGVSRQLVARYRKKPGAPPINDLDAWIEFIAGEGARSETLPVKLRAALTEQRIRLLKAQADKAELEHSVIRGELIEFKEVEAMVHEVIGVGYWGEYDRMSFEMPPNLVGLSAQQMFIEFKREKVKMFKNSQEMVRKFCEKYEAKRKSAAKKEAKQ